MARAVSCKRKSDHITPVLHDLHWLKIRQRIHYKIISLTYTALQTGQPKYLRNLLTLQTARSTRSGSLITLSRSPAPKLKISDRSFQYHAPVLWNSLPPHLRLPSSPTSSSSSTKNNILALTRKEFHTKLKTHLFKQSFPP